MVGVWTALVGRGVYHRIERSEKRWLNNEKQRDEAFHALLSFRVRRHVAWLGALSHWAMLLFVPTCKDREHGPSYRATF
jgi:hypothetical protein